MPRQVVTFDLWETLLLDEPEVERRRVELRCEQLRDVLSKQGVEVTVQDVKRGHDQSTSWLMESWKTWREVPTLEHVKYVVKAAAGENVALSPEFLGELEEAYCSPVLAAPPVLNPEAVSTLQSLRDRGSPVGLICNTGRAPGKTLRQLLDRLGILDYFEATVFSDELGWRKPDQRIFQETARRLGASPANIVHVGDNPEDDVWGAKQAGMQALLFDRKVPGEFINDPHSLYALTRTPTGERSIEPDRTIRSLREVLPYLEDSL